jgi:broad specificity phosphatase PhoE
MKLYLVRHGESVDDIEDCWGGAADFVLTESGRQTANSLASKLADSKIEVLYSSPLRRASETAALVAKAAGCAVQTIPNLMERNSYGVISGVNKAKAKDIFGYLLSTLKGKPGDYYAGESIVGDEPVAAFDSRVKAAFDSILSHANGRNVVGIVTHGNVTRSIYRNILGIPGKVDLELLAMTVINYSSGKFTIERSEGVIIKQ